MSCQGCQSAPLDSAGCPLRRCLPLRHNIRPYSGVLAALLPLTCATQLPPTAPAIGPHLTALNAFSGPTQPSGMFIACHPATVPVLSPTPQRGVPCQACRPRKCCQACSAGCPAFRSWTTAASFWRPCLRSTPCLASLSLGPWLSCPHCLRRTQSLSFRWGFCSSTDGQWAATCSASMLSSQVSRPVCCIVLLQKPSSGFEPDGCQVCHCRPCVVRCSGAQDSCNEPRPGSRPAACCMSVRRPFI